MLSFAFRLCHFNCFELISCYGNIYDSSLKVHIFYTFESRLVIKYFPVTFILLINSNSYDLAKILDKSSFVESLCYASVTFCLSQLTFEMHFDIWKFKCPFKKGEKIKVIKAKSTASVNALCSSINKREMLGLQILWQTTHTRRVGWTFFGTSLFIWNHIHMRFLYTSMK